MDGLLGRFKHIDHQRTRGFSPKVRTGCVSCKSARVKCNEAKPTCKRCARRNITCRYQLPVANIFHCSSETGNTEVVNSRGEYVFKHTIFKEATNEPRHKPQPTPPRRTSSGSARKVASPRTSRPAHSVNARSPRRTFAVELEGASRHKTHSFLGTSVPFCTDMKHATALQYFLEVPAPKIAYNMASYFFTVTLPQASWVHPAIKESMVALSTLDASLRATSSAKWTSRPALYHYNKAINALATSKPARHVTLLVCMLLWLYEQIDNQHTRANFHRASAARLLDEWRSHELGVDRILDDYIALYLEPNFLMGLKVTAPVKLCREVLSTLHTLPGHSADGTETCTYDEALSDLRACIDRFCTICEYGSLRDEDFLIGISLASLRMWNYQFEHYGGSTWAVDGPMLLSHATVVAMLVQETELGYKAKDADWQRAFDFLQDESLKISWMTDEQQDAHYSLSNGIALIEAVRSSSRATENPQLLNLD